MHRILIFNWQLMHHLTYRYSQHDIFIVCNLCCTEEILFPRPFSPCLPYTIPERREGRKGLSTGALSWHPYTLVHMPTRQQYLQTCAQHGVGMLERIAVHSLQNSAWWDIGTKGLQQYSICAYCIMQLEVEWRPIYTQTFTSKFAQ